MLSIGNPPVQLENFDNVDLGTGDVLDFSEDFYPDDSFDPSEIDEEGFSNFEDGNDPYSNF